MTTTDIVYIQRLMRIATPRVANHNAGFTPSSSKIPLTGSPSYTSVQTTLTVDGKTRVGRPSLHRKHSLQTDPRSSDKLRSQYSRAQGRPIRNFRFTPALLLCCFLVPTWLFGQAASKSGASAGDDFSFRPKDPATLTGFDHFYNLEYEAAVRDFRQVLRRHPDDPFAINHLLSAILFHELYRMGVLNTGEYANDSFIKAAHRPPDSQADNEIKDLVTKAQKTEQSRLSANPNDVEALYARGVTRAQFATYTALIEHAWFSALRNAVGARHDHERVLELTPENTGAKLIVGTHNYVVGSLPWALRSAGAMAGLGGNKEKGLLFLRECASGHGETAADARILLVLFLRRERRYQEALPLARELIAAYPRNVLMALEEGNLLRADGKLDEAAASYIKVWQAGKNGRYPGSHYEMAGISLGDLLRVRKDYGGAAGAYDSSAAVANPDIDLAQRANLGAGEMYDLLKKRDLAVKNYQLVVSSGANTPSGETAARYLKQPYQGQ